MYRPLLHSPLIALCLITACHEPPRATTTATKTSAIASVEGDVESGIDAPWRLEPLPRPEISDPADYPLVPIVVSIHDASMQSDPDTMVHLGDFCRLVVVEQWNNGPPPPPYDYQTLTTTIRPNSVPLANNSLREIERSDKWPDTNDVAGNHKLCRRWAGEDCTNVLNVGSSAEWHATFTYKIRQLDTEYYPLMMGDYVYFEFYAFVARAGHACPPPGTYDYSDPNLDVPSDRLEAISSSMYATRGFAAVHLGADLPRFDSGWVYGDLHYHSQGTDNEGESAYAYRPTLQAMRAIGMDFLFATDHASDSGQTTDIDPIFIDSVSTFLPSFTPEFVEDFILGLVDDYGLGFQPNIDGARDMNAKRWKAMHGVLNKPGSGANAEVLKSIPGRDFAPRIFLGGEVDVIPEMTSVERNSLGLHYGNNRIYRWADACHEIPPALQTALEVTTAVTCNSPYDLSEVTSDPFRYTVKDIQGLGERLYARQHLVHLPLDPARDDAFVSSDTGKYGGARKRLNVMLVDDYEIEQKGYMFLAHPVNRARGSDVGRLGPDIVPYSYAQLRTAFDSEYVLGLQLWNEDTRMTGGLNWLGLEPHGYNELHHGAFAWDRMLQWGLQPSQTINLSWLDPTMPRRVFMAGGSDAHGDWNYRREGAIEGTSVTTDSAIGKPRNLVNVGQQLTDTVVDHNGGLVPALGQQQVVEALVSGEFMVTDGPAVRIAIDTNMNGEIDDEDVPMGGVATMNQGRLQDGTIPLIVEWSSNGEWGVIDHIDLYVGVASYSMDATLVYAPENHGVRGSETPQGTPFQEPYIDHLGVQHVALNDGYMKDPSGQLRIVPPGPTSGYVGRAYVSLNPASFPAGRLRLEEYPVTPGSCTSECTPHGCTIVCTDPSAPPPDYIFEGPARPDRLYIRGFARTQRPAICSQLPPEALPYDVRRSCIERLAFTNPIWVNNPPMTCTREDPCPPPVAGPWGSCSGNDGVCLGDQKRGVTKYSCENSVCAEKYEKESQNCPINDGNTCSHSIVGEWSDCGGAGDLSCDGTKTRIRTDKRCDFGACKPVQVLEQQNCIMPNGTQCSNDCYCVVSDCRREHKTCINGGCFAISGGPGYGCGEPCGGPQCVPE